MEPIVGLNGHGRAVGGNLNWDLHDQMDAKAACEIPEAGRYGVANWVMTGNLGLAIRDQTVGNMFKQPGIDLVPERSERRLGRRSPTPIKPVGMSWERSTSQRSRSGRRAGLSRTPCASC